MSLDERRYGHGAGTGIADRPSVKGPMQRGTALYSDDARSVPRGVDAPMLGLGYKTRTAFSTLGMQNSLINDESERLLNEGLTTVQEAFDRRTAVLQGELLESRQTASTQRENINSLEKDRAALNQRIADLESVIQAQAIDIKSLIESKNTVTEKYNVLKKSAAQLDSFRKNIVSMVEYGPGLASALHAADANLSFNLSDSTEALPRQNSPTRSHHSAYSKRSSGAYSPTSNRINNMPLNSGGSGSPYRESANIVSSSVSNNRVSNDGYHLHLQHQQQQPLSNPYGSILEGSSFLNANDLKSFEMASQTLDYSLALPTQTQLSSSLSTQNGTQQSNQQSNQLLRPGQLQQEKQALQQNHNHDYLNQQANQSQELPQSQQSTQKLKEESDSASSAMSHFSNALKSNTSLSTPNLSQTLHTGRGANQRKLSTGGGPEPGSHSANNSNSKSSLAVQTTTTIGNKPMERVNRRNETSGASNSGHSTRLGGSSNTPASSSQTHPMSKTPTPAPTNSTNASTLSSAPIDAPTLYKQIRDALSQSEFEAFAGYVAGFNAGELSADEAVKNIGRIVKDRGLFSRMRTLIYTALAESARGENSGGGGGGGGSA
ncbi:hypothetical protein HDU81_009321 [Chytriomyces hyalinus]|nr:hypothetical protein HDU81_009321 [Chytriomyces hyalinus]